ncbi:hypothetical protein EOPP23_14995 [Endozoicomonas sp. OPT23]|uniref:GNAT family N-acetyltransferase n=1 Tax=Endozoicomonas sp. OPT23 TaxID=2072845 RepID=UPI00129AA288|nr:GNAT family protein [Endozoicomonas sp. OPT23]MRI34295.1 hypothetical protein [Endozoicomonas sp. OPT23]
MNSNKFDLDVFIEGELTDLCIATEAFAYSSNWYSWFNDKNVNKYLEQGAIPNTRELQQKFFLSVANDRLPLIIVDKNKVPIGTISLSFIDHVKKTCDIALVVSNDGDRKYKPYISLEAMALMTTHAFEMLGMKRISAGQHIELKGWQNRLELIGYKLEGIHFGKFIKGNHTSDVLSISMNLEDFDFLTKSRNGKLWDSFEFMRKRIKSMPRSSIFNEFLEFYNTTRSDYYEKLFKL